MQNNEKMIIYNIFPLLAGTFDTWDTHLERAADMGFNWVFVNPIQRPGYSGSLYSIVDYFDLNPLLINEKSEKSPIEQVKSMIEKAESLGLNVMVDLVINHCAFDSELIKDHPNWFEWENGEVARPSCDEEGKTIVWGDLARFNHQNSDDKEGMFQYFMKVMHFLLNLGFKGFRCDAAYQIPSDFWRRLIHETKRVHPEAVFLAETLGCTADETRQTAEGGFDYIFNSSKWWNYEGFWLMEQYELTREIAASISFPESHDTPRLADEVWGNVSSLKQRYLFAATFSAGVMMPMGYEFGFRKKPHVVDSRPEDWEESDIDICDFITKVNEIKAKYRIFQEEAPTQLLHNHNPNAVILWKASTKTNEEALVIINKDIFDRQYFYANNLHDFVQAGAPLTDVSPEYPVDYVAAPFEYELNPGQGLIMVTQRD